MNVINSRCWKEWHSATKLLPTLYNKIQAILGQDKSSAYLLSRIAYRPVRCCPPFRWPPPKPPIGLNVDAQGRVERKDVRARQAAIHGWPVLPTPLGWVGGKAWCLTSRKQKNGWWYARMPGKLLSSPSKYSQSKDDMNLQHLTLWPECSVSPPRMNKNHKAQKTCHIREKCKWNLKHWAPKKWSF
jgi:hypothetical protein